MSKEKSYAEKLDETIAQFAGQFEAVLSAIVRDSVARVVTETAVNQRWQQKHPVAAAPARRGRPKGSKNKPKNKPKAPARIVNGKRYCSVSGCPRPIVAKDMCGTHYRKAWRDAKRAGIPNGIAAAVGS